MQSTSDPISRAPIYVQQNEPPDSWYCPECKTTCNYSKGYVGGRGWNRPRCICEKAEYLERRRQSRREQNERTLLEAKQSAISGLGLPKRYASVTMSALAVDAHNTKAIDVANQWIADGLKNTRGLYIYGKPGTGKTCLACAVLSELASKGTLLRRRRLIDFTDEVEVGIPLEYYEIVPTVFLNAAHWISERRKFDDESDNASMEAGLLLLDDIGVENPSDWVKEQLYLLINTRYDAKALTIVTSNSDLAKLAALLTPRIASRLAEMCVQVPLGGPDRRLT